MKIKVQVKPNSKKEGIQAGSDGGLVVRVNAPPVDGKANERVIELLSKHFKKPKSAFILKSGHKGKNKIFEIV